MSPRVIDLGTGEGRDLLHFARNGFRAEGIDTSATGLAKAQERAAAEKLSIWTRQADLRTVLLQGPYHVVYSSGTLTYLAPDERKGRFSHFKEVTSPGGIHAVNAFVEKPYLGMPLDWGADEHYYRSGELLSHYWDWEIIESMEEEFECTSGGVPHCHAMDTVIARRRPKTWIAR
jgi:tellurite methyltransferase